MVEESVCSLSRCLQLKVSREDPVRVPFRVVGLPEGWTGGGSASMRTQNCWQDSVLHRLLAKGMLTFLARGPIRRATHNIATAFLNRWTSKSDQNKWHSPLGADYTKVERQRRRQRSLGLSQRLLTTSYYSKQPNVGNKLMDHYVVLLTHSRILHCNENA